VYGVWELGNWLEKVAELFWTALSSRLASSPRVPINTWCACHAEDCRALYYAPKQLDRVIRVSTFEDVKLVADVLAIIQGTRQDAHMKPG
jgi:hypothetical protein